MSEFSSLDRTDKILVLASWIIAGAGVFCAFMIKVERESLRQHEQEMRLRKEQDK